MIDVYAQNTNLPHPSIQSGHIPDYSDHPLAPGGIAERGDPYFQPYVPRGIYKNVAFKDLPTIAQGHILHQTCLNSAVPFADGVRKAGKLFCALLKKQAKRGSDTVTTTHSHICYALDIAPKSSHRHWSSLKKTKFFTIQTVHNEKYGTQMAVQFSEEAYEVRDWDIRDYQTVFNKNSGNSKGGVLPKMTNTPPSETQAGSHSPNPSISKYNHKDLYLCSGKNKKPVTKISEEEKKAVSREETFFETSEQPQDPIALKSNEVKGKTEPLSQTPTKSTERQEVKKETIHQKARDRKDLKKEQPTQSSRIQVSTKPQTGRTENELNTIAAEAYEEFLVLFNPAEDKRFECHKIDFIRMVKARTKSHLGCAKDIKTYMRKFSINQYLMGKRLGSNGKFFHPSLYALFSKKIIDDYQKKEYSKYFIPYNELDLSQQAEARSTQDTAVSQELLEKISLALLGGSDKNEADPEQTQEIIKIITSYAVQKAEKQDLMTQTPEKKTNELNPLPVLKSSSSDQATIRVVNQDKAWIKKGESYWQTLDLTCRKKWEDDFIDAIRRGETGFRVDQDIHDPMFRKFKTVPFMTWIGKILEQEEQQEINIAPEMEIEEIDSTLLDLEEPEDVEFEDFPKEELEQSDTEGLWVAHAQHKPSSYGQSIRRTLHTLLLFASLWQSAQAVEIKSCFTPQQQCLPLIVHELNNARSEILMQAYSLTSKPISKALREAHDRGVKVKILVDPSQEKSPHSQVGLLKGSGIEVMVDDKVRIAHNKIIVIDGKTLIGGSYNFSAAAEKKNAENLIIVKDDPVVQEYRQNWWRRKQKCRSLRKETPSRKKVSDVFQEFTKFRKETG